MSWRRKIAKRIGWRLWLLRQAWKVPAREKLAQDEALKAARARQALANEFARGYVQGWVDCYADFNGASRNAPLADAAGPPWTH